MREPPGQLKRDPYGNRLRFWQGEKIDAQPSGAFKGATLRRKNN